MSEVEVAELEVGWHRLSMWAALPVALSLLRPKVLLGLLPVLVTVLVGLPAVIAAGRWDVAVAVGVVVVSGAGRVGGLGAGVAAPLPLPPR